MSVPISYLTVILIWSTTPLAIQWSSEGTGYAFAVSSRMVLGAVIAMMMTIVLRLDVPWHRAAIKTYMFSGLGISISLMIVYWAAQFIPSGWISLIFGLSPIMTGIIMFLLYGENEFSRARLIGIMFAVSGLAMVFATGFSLSVSAVQGVSAVLLSTAIYSFTAIQVKQHNDGIPALTITAVGLLFAMPLYIVSWYLLDGKIPDVIATRAGMSILYLAFFGSVIGFALFFYILKHVSATRVSLITLVTPVTALLLGKYLNDEALSLQIMLGAGMILLGLASYEFGGIVKWLRYRA